MNITSLAFSSPGTRYNHSQHPKDLPVCNELLTAIDQFKKFLTEQKKIREELVNMSNLPLVKLKDDLISMLHQVSSVASGLRQISIQCNRLKDDVLKEEKNIGMAQRLSEPGSSLQLENTTTTEYFLTKLMEFDNQIKLYKQEMDVMDQYISSQTQYNLTPKDLVTLLRQLDDEFMLLASQLYTSYEHVRVLKSRYIRNLRVLTGESRNPFAEVEASSLKLRQLEDALNGTSLLSDKKLSTLSTPYGPSPFATASIAPASLGQKSSLIPASQSTASPFIATNTLQPTASSGNGLFSGLSTFGQSLTSSNTFTLPAAATSCSPFQFGATTTGAPAQKPLFGFATPSTTTFGLAAASQPASCGSTPAFGFGSIGSTGSNLFGNIGSTGSNLFGNIGSTGSNLFGKK